MKINCYKISFQVYILYALLPVLHSISGYIQIAIIMTAFAFLLLSMLSNIDSISTMQTFVLLLLSFLFAYMIYMGEYTVTIFEQQYGLAKFLMLLLFWFPMYMLPGLSKGITETKEDIFNLILVLCCITSITTLIGIFRFEEPCRALAKGTSALTDYYQSLNIGGYGFVYALILLIPALLHKYKITKRKIYIGIILLFTICIIGASYGTAFVVFAIVMGVYLYLQIKCNVVIKTIITFIIGIMVFSYDSWKQIVKWIYLILEKIGVESLSSRMEMVYRSLTIDSQVMHLEERVALREMSLDVFNKNPFLGNLELNNKQALGMHSEICDMLGGTGIIGVLLFFILIAAIAYFLKRQIVSRDMRNIYISILAGMIFLIYYNTIITSIEILLIICCVIFSEEKNNGEKRI